MDERQQLLACANNCASLLNDMARCENEYSYLFDKETKYKKRSGWVWLGLILCPLLALGAICDILTNKDLVSPVPDLIGMFICLGISAICVMSVINHRKRKARMPVVVEEHAALCADPAISWLPPDYRNSSFARKIIEYLYNMRAKTLQEAINLFETEKHQETMELIAAIGAMNGTRY